MHNDKELKIWQEGIILAKLIYQATANFPSNEKYGLTSQINRSAVSIPSNIAEGAGRSYDKEFIQFLGIALDSAFELETQIILANSFGFIKEENFSELSE
ncbi:four helix bundle protein [Adhaeribacter arboris]|uniref:four helix bundle protein n=1 Tax=Adhaeribacter arboris TaxID=2072846 RepID=UPI0018EAFD31|nr:four helix bundle protein [Adhaeribacter arboris]